MDLLIEFEEISKSFKEFIQKHTLLSSDSPINKNMLRDIDMEFNSLLNEIKAAYEKNLEINEKYLLKVTALIDKYNKNTNTNAKAYNKKISSIESNTKKLKQELNERLNKIEDDTKYKHEDANLELEAYYTQTEYSKDYLKNNNENNLNDYKYQFENASYSYKENVTKYNLLLEKDLYEHSNKHALSLSTFDTELDNSEAYYINKIAEYQKELDHATAEYDETKQEQRDTKKRESTLLNDNIRSLVNLNNFLSLQEKAEFDTNQNIIKTERNTNRQKIQIDSQRVSREFVIKNNNLIDSINSKKAVLEKEIYEERKKYAFKKLLIHKDEETALRTSLFSPEKDRKNINKKYNKMYSDLENELNAIINKKNVEFSINQEINQHYQRILDIKRYYDLKRLNEMESNDIKYFQELENIDQNDYEYKTDCIKENYNINAAKARNDSELKGFLEDQVYKKKNSEHQIKIAKIQYEIDKLNVKLEATRKLRDEMHKIDNERDIRTVNFIKVNNVLEIEKAKVLYTYNKSRYEKNVEIENSDLSLDFQKLDLNNEEKRIEVESTLNIQDAISNYDKYQIEIEKLKLDRKQEYDLKIAEIEYEALKEKEITDLLFERFKLSYKEIETISSHIITAIRALEYYTTNVIDYLFNNITIKAETINPIRVFLNNFINIIVQVASTSINVYTDKIDSMKNSQVDFERNIRYKDDYDTIENEYLIANDSELKKIGELNVRITKNRDDINDYKNLITKCQNQITFLKAQEGDKKGTNKSKITELRRHIRNSQTEIDRINAEIEILKSRIKQIEIKLDEIKVSYDAAKSSIEDKQIENSHLYFELYDKITNLFYNTLKNINETVFKNTSDFTPDSFEDDIREYRLNVIEHNESTFNTLYKYINHFMDETLETNVKKLNAQAEDLRVKKYNEDSSYQATLISDKKNSDKMLNELNESRFSAEKKANQEKANLAAKRKNYANIKKEINNKLTSDMNKINDLFYSDYYAIVSNQEDIVRFYKENIKLCDERENDLKIELTKNNEESSTNLKRRLTSFIENENDLQEEIPSEIIKYKKNSKAKIVDREAEYQKTKVSNKALYIKNKIELNHSLMQYKYSIATTIKELEKERKVKLRKEAYLHRKNLRHLKRGL